MLNHWDTFETNITLHVNYTSIKNACTVSKTLLSFSRSVVSHSLQPCGLKHARLPRPPLPPHHMCSPWGCKEWGTTEQLTLSLFTWQRLTQYCKANYPPIKNKIFKNPKKNINMWKTIFVPMKLFLTTLTRIHYSWALILSSSFLQVFKTFRMKVLLLKLEYLITGGNYNTYQHTSKSSHRTE